MVRPRLWRKADKTVGAFRHHSGVGARGLCDVWNVGTEDADENSQ